MRKTIVWIIVAAIVIVGGIWWWMASRTGANVPSSPAASSNNANATSSTSTASLPQGNSNQAINQEMTSINAQMNGLSSDTASVSQSMNDQPVPQTQ